MLVPCEKLIRRFLPAMKASVAKRLVRDRGYTEVQTAKILGLTQASVSKYVSGKYSDEIKRIEKNPRLASLADEVANAIAACENDDEAPASAICRSCERFFGKEWSCAVSASSRRSEGVNLIMELIREVR